MANPIELTVIVPAYNEERRIPRNLPRILGYLRERPFSWELLVVEDGSGDRTCEVTREVLGSEGRARLLSFADNRGKGFAVREGVKASRGRRVLFLDVDLSVPIEASEAALKLLDAGADAVIGSRGLHDSRIVRCQPLYRRLGSKAFNGLRNLLVGLSKYSDSQCGFKAFRGDVARWAFGCSVVDGFMFDVEILFLLDRAGLQVRELPVEWTNDEDSKLRLVRDTLRMFRDLLKVRLRHWRALPPPGLAGDRAVPKSVSILVPVYNEAATCARLLEAVAVADCAGLAKEIVVVESNSTDGTRAVVQDFERRGVVKALYEDRPQGKGHALKAALAAASGDVVLVQDADLEYKVAEYPELLRPLVEGRADFVLGSRHLGAGTWRIRAFITEGASARLINLGGLLYTGLFNALYGVKLTDPATMFKVFRRDALEGVRLRSNWFDLDWEIVAKLIRRGRLPVEVPVSYSSRSVEEGKKIRFWRDGPMVLWAIFRFRFCD